MKDDYVDAPAMEETRPMKLRRAGVCSDAFRASLLLAISLDASLGTFLSLTTEHDLSSFALHKNVYTALECTALRTSERRMWRTKTHVQNFPLEFI